MTDQSSFEATTVDAPQNILALVKIFEKAVNAVGRVSAKQTNNGNDKEYAAAVDAALVLADGIVAEEPQNESLHNDITRGLQFIFDDASTSAPRLNPGCDLFRLNVDTALRVDQKIREIGQQSQQARPMIR